MKFAALLFAAVALVACGTEEETGSDLVGDATAGEAVWTDNTCFTCHGADAISGTAGVNLVDVAANEASEFSSTVLNGEGGMPSFDLTEQEIADLRAYIATL
jgi:mono/diheme cytochrome c family protein